MDEWKMSGSQNIPAERLGLILGWLLRITAQPVSEMRDGLISDTCFYLNSVITNSRRPGTQSKDLSALCEARKQLEINLNAACLFSAREKREKASDDTFTVKMLQHDQAGIDHAAQACWWWSAVTITQESYPQIETILALSKGGEGSCFTSSVLTKTEQRLLQLVGVCMFVF